jgi:Bifunctional DNA primase/polymerase, N-terminal
MPKSYTDPNPGISILEDRATKEKVAANVGRAIELAGRLSSAHPLDDEQMERERWQAESNALADASPFYASARSAGVHFSVLPLEPGGTKPLVHPTEATSEPRQLLEWWAATPTANVGVALGRRGNLVALRIADNDAYTRLVEMVGGKVSGSGTEQKWTEWRDLSGARVRLYVPEEPFEIRFRGGWEKELTRIGAELGRERLKRQPEASFLVWSFPTIESGQDVFNYPSRVIAEGLRLLGEGETMAWSGSILEGNVQVAAPAATPPVMPVWLAATLLGKPRSRKAVQAAREAHEKAVRAQNAYWETYVAERMAAMDRAMQEARAEYEKAARALARVEAEEQAS